MQFLGDPQRIGTLVNIDLNSNCNPLGSIPLTIERPIISLFDLSRWFDVFLVFFNLQLIIDDSLSNPG